MRALPCCRSCSASIPHGRTRGTTWVSSIWQRVTRRGPRLLEGMTLAIEPMITMGNPTTRTLSDKWTVVTADGSLSAHFEHTVAITANGPRILTAA